MGFYTKTFRELQKIFFFLVEKGYIDVFFKNETTINIEQDGQWEEDQ